MAPELLSLDSDNAWYSAAVDIYSFGIILNAMWRRRKPYEEGDFNGVLQMFFSIVEGTRPRIPEDCPPHLAQLMRQCWASAPGDRISAVEVLQRLNVHGGEEEEEEEEGAEGGAEGGGAEEDAEEGGPRGSGPQAEAAWRKL
jgi:hypothetical protein